jgi:hypothetical protein
VVVSWGLTDALFLLLLGLVLASSSEDVLALVEGLPRFLAGSIVLLSSSEGVVSFFAFLGSDFLEGLGGSPNISSSG